jgi:hypothetical protein
LEGPTADQRVFGIYGPGKARDVLSQLLQGTSYNVIMIGDQGAGTPREIVLSSRNTAAATPAAKSPTPSTDEDDSDEDDQAQPQPMPPGRTGFGQRTPQEIQQEMELRQQQMQQMQQQRQPQGQPPNNPQ